MKKETIGDYEVLASVHVGEKEVVIGEKAPNNDGLRFMCGYMERTDIFNLCNECVYSDDYIEIAHLFGSRIKEAAELFQNREKELGIPVTVITEKDCIPDHHSYDINGKIIAIDPKVLKPEFQRADKQLYLVTGGFGASANSRGSAVFCTNLLTGKSIRYERMDVMGEVKLECMPEWAKRKSETINEFRAKKHKDRER